MRKRRVEVDLRLVPWVVVELGSTLFALSIYHHKMRHQTVRTLSSLWILSITSAYPVRSIENSDGTLQYGEDTMELSPLS